jgi:hypothetical protein
VFARYPRRRVAEYFVGIFDTRARLASEVDSGWPQVRRTTGHGPSVQRAVVPRKRAREDVSRYRMFASPALCRNPGGTTDPVQASCQLDHCRWRVTPAVGTAARDSSLPSEPEVARTGPQEMGIRSPAPRAVSLTVPVSEVVRSKVGFFYICCGVRPGSGSPPVTKQSNKTLQGRAAKPDFGSLPPRGRPQPVVGSQFAGLRWKGRSRAVSGALQHVRMNGALSTAGVRTNPAQRTRQVRRNPLVGSSRR